MKKIIAGVALGAFMAGGVSSMASAYEFAQIEVKTRAGVSVTGASVTSTSDVRATTGVKVGGEASIVNLVAKARVQADKEIIRRLDALNALLARVNAMTQLSADAKARLVAQIQADIDALNTAKVRIEAAASSTATSSLKEHIKGIERSHGAFALTVQQGVIQSAADRIMDVAAALTTLSEKLQVRINEAQSSGADVSISVALFADMNAKIASAKASAQTAASAMAALKADNGDQAVARANAAVRADARTKIVSAQRDLNTARQDARKIAVMLVQLKAKASASSSATSSGN